MSKTIFVDADGLPYIAGGSGCERWYTAVFEDEDGELSTIRVPSAAEVKAYAAEKELTLIDRELEIIPQPLAFALQICKSKLQEMQRRYGQDLQVYIKGDGTNFRDEVATLHGYKANRLDVEKPPWNAEVYQYLSDHWNAREVSGKEVDDEIATRAYESSKDYIVCSPDKDLDQIEGTHWNYAKNVEYEIDNWEARAFFWQQCLSGDNADNIKGCWKMGEKGASDKVWDWVSGMMSDEEIWAGIVEIYEDSMGLKGCPYAGMPAEQVAIENARLVWMQTEHLRLWTPPGAELEYLTGDLDD